MHIRIVTLFPEFFNSPLEAGLLGRAREDNLLDVSLHNPRDDAVDKHKSVDDRPYGGGPGMVMLLQPLAATLRKLGHEAPGKPQPGRLLYMSPKGRPLDQALSRELAGEVAAGQVPTILCGRYEGIDARLDDLFPVEHVSVGDFVLNGGETAALAVLEAVARLLPGFMGHAESGTEESFSRHLLEYPHYTRPEVFENIPTPLVLLSGDHARIKEWRQERSLETTLARRPELLDNALLSSDELEYLSSLPRTSPTRNLYCALVHYPVLDKEKKSVAVSLTNLDIHDIARSSHTYGLGGYYIVTPLKDQRNLLETLVTHWTYGAGGKSNPDRAAAFSLVKGVECIEEAVRDITAATGESPYVVGTSASGAGNLGFAALRKIVYARPVLLLFGTGHGLAPTLQDRCDAMLAPIRPLSRYNHLSVRAAAAIIMDRIAGNW